jgi:rare lipoprotein A
MNNIRVEPMDRSGFQLAVFGSLAVVFGFLLFIAYGGAKDAEDLMAEVKRLEIEISDNSATMATLSDRLIAMQEAVTLIGTASWYGERERGRQTANGEDFDPTLLTAASYFLPFGSRWRVTEIKTGRSCVVRINDRGPHIIGRVIDLSEAAARRLGIVGAGLAKVRITPEV